MGINEGDNYEADFIDPDGESVADSLLALFEAESGISIAWREEKENPDSMASKLADLMSKIPEMKDKIPPPEERINQLADITIPVSMLLNLAKMATVGCLAASEIGLDVPIKAVELSDDGAGPGNVEGMIQAYYSDQRDAERGVGMALMTAGYIAKKGADHHSAKRKAKMEQELENLEVPDCLPEGFGDPS